MTLFFFVVTASIKRELLAGHLADRRRAALPILAAPGRDGGARPPLRLDQRREPGRPRLGHPDGHGHRLRGRGAVAAGAPGARRHEDLPADPGRGRRPRRHRPDRRRLLRVGSRCRGCWRRSAALLFSPPCSGGGSARGAGLRRRRRRCAGWRWRGREWSRTMAGVAFALLTPMRRPDPALAPGRAAPLLAAMSDGGAEAADRSAEALRDLRRLARESSSPLERVLQRVTPWVSYLVVPAFALANAGLRVRGLHLDPVGQPGRGGCGAGLRRRQAASASCSPAGPPAGCGWARSRTTAPGRRSPAPRSAPASASPSPSSSPGCPSSPPADQDAARLGRADRQRRRRGRRSSLRLPDVPAPAGAPPRTPTRIGSPHDLAPRDPAPRDPAPRPDRLPQPQPVARRPGARLDRRRTPCRARPTSTWPSSAAATPASGRRTTSPRPTRRCGSPSWSARSSASGRAAATAAGARRSSRRPAQGRRRHGREAARRHAAGDERHGRRDRQGLRGRGHRLRLPARAATCRWRATRPSWSRAAGGGRRLRGSGASATTTCACSTAAEAGDRL